MKPLALIFCLVLGLAWAGCVSQTGANARLDALVQELTDAPAWSDLRAETLDPDGSKLVAVCRKIAPLRLRELRYVEFHYLERFETSRLRMTTVIDAEGRSHQRPFPQITISPENREDYRRAWSKLHILHRIYFAVPDEIGPPVRPATHAQGKDRLFPLEHVEGTFRIAAVLDKDVPADSPRAEFAYLARAYGSRHSGEKARYDF